ncbi:MAG: hypothetical protein OXI60_01520 [Acidiferrobacterales bacterium]|nr:hypothetical protein [Acidiferrobacterales bacterium]
MENSVQQIQRWILAPLRNERFDTLGQLNKALGPLLEELNRKPFSKRPGSRKKIFDTTGCACTSPPAAFAISTR